MHKKKQRGAKKQETETLQVYVNIKHIYHQYRDMQNSTVTANSKMQTWQGNAITEMEIQTLQGRHNLKKQMQPLQGMQHNRDTQP